MREYIVCFSFSCTAIVHFVQFNTWICIENKFRKKVFVTFTFLSRILCNGRQASNEICREFCVHCMCNANKFTLYQSQVTMMIYYHCFGAFACWKIMPQPSHCVHVSTNQNKKNKNGSGSLKPKNDIWKWQHDEIFFYFVFFIFLICLWWKSSDKKITLRSNQTWVHRSISNNIIQKAHCACN